MRVAVVTPTMKSGEKGGAEALYAGLVRAFRSSGHDADQIEVVIDESTFDTILESYARCEALDLHAYDLVVSTKAPSFMVRHPRHVSYLLHTIRVFYDMFDREFADATAERRRQRATIHQLDKRGLHPDRLCGHFANGRTTFQRLYDIDPWWRRIEFEALHHPPALDGYLPPRPGEFILLPGRLHRWKRVDLAIEAFKRVKADLPLKIVGGGEDEALFRELARDDARIEFLGTVSDRALVELYSRAVAVPFVPQQEDFGLITIEAFRSRKPVITCTDSGETLAFVKNGVTGCVAAPEPQAIAERIDWLVAHRVEAEAMGERGHAAVSHITWERVVSRLVAAASNRSRVAVTRGSAPGVCNVAVVDMQPIEPAVGGGRVRLLGLYHGLGEGMRTTYVGTYDWRGESYRRVRHSETLEEITVPLSNRHFEAVESLEREVRSTSVIDLSFSRLATLSPDYLAHVVAAIADAEVVVFSHPWVYPLVKDTLDRSRHLVVYDAQNVESMLRTTLLGDSPLESELARIVTEDERDLCREADLVLACSQEDRLLFAELYGIPVENVVVAANGTFVASTAPADEAQRNEMKSALGLPPGPTAIFMGSAYGPNIEAARFICRDVAPRLPHVTFAICGGVADVVRADVASENVRATGTLTDADKARYFAAADLALNPMFVGSGTNVKMFDFMAAGLPVVTTAIGARGITQGSTPAFRVREAREFVEAIEELVRDRGSREALGRAGRQLVEEAYSWERISARLGLLLARRRSTLGTPAPRFSVIVATYERHDHLRRLLNRLAAQTCRDFEVVIVDQSAQRCDDAASCEGLDVFYVHTDVRGVTKARNTAAFFARGEILAFTDDDCLPEADWLEKAAGYFADPAVVGVEGMVTTEKLNDPRFRTVTNVGFEGIGFMTANLLLRRSTFCAIDGFDERFDIPFREDTDLAWRALAHGTIPYGRDVRVFHPPHPRDVEREGHAERNSFFEKDALLAQKHPRRYRTLIGAEGHFRGTAGFSQHVRRGAEKYGVDLDPAVQWLARSQDVRAMVEAE